MLDYVDKIQELARKIWSQDEIRCREADSFRSQMGFRTTRRKDCGVKVLDALLEEHDKFTAILKDKEILVHVIQRLAKRASPKMIHVVAAQMQNFTRVLSPDEFGKFMRIVLRHPHSSPRVAALGEYIGDYAKLFLDDGKTPSDLDKESLKDFLIGLDKSEFEAGKIARIGKMLRILGPEDIYGLRQCFDPDDFPTKIYAILCEAREGMPKRNSRLRRPQVASCGP